MSQNVLTPEKLKSYPQQPHGGKLVDQILHGKEREDALERVNHLPRIMVDMEAVITLEMIATGVLSRNEAFMNEEDYKSVLREGRLKNGLVWPVLLSFAPVGNRNKQLIASLYIVDDIVLIDEQKELVVLLTLEDIFDYDRDYRATHLFGTTDRNHPGVDAIYRRMGDTALGGPIKLLNRMHWGPFEPLRLEPKDTWHQFYEEKEMSSVGGFI